MDKLIFFWTIEDNKLSWDANCKYIIQKVNTRMQQLRGEQGFGAKMHEMVHLWILFCRSVFDQSCIVCGTSLTQENVRDLERAQTIFAKLVSKEKYTNYENAINLLDLDSLEEKRNKMCLKFAKNSIKSKALN